MCPCHSLGCARDGYVCFASQWGGGSGSGWCAMHDDKNGQSSGKIVHRVKVVFNNGVPAAALRWTQRRIPFFGPRVFLELNSG